LQTTQSALEKAREMSRQGSDGYAQLPFHSTGKHAIYYLTDLIEFRIESSPHQLPFFLRTLAVMLGPDYCREIGVAYPQPKADGMAAPMAQAPGIAAMLGVAPIGDEVAAQPKHDAKSKKAKNLAMQAALKAGATVQRNVLRGFASLHAFLMQAEPDDQWLFACPNNGRPYDAIAAIFAGPGDVRFEWLTLTDYLQRVSEAAIRDRNVRQDREATALGELIGTVTKPANAEKKARSIDD
jgi:hypothetical protein